MSSTVVDEAFERLYRHHVRDVYRFALALLRNPAEAEDVTQTTFLNAYRALEAGEQPRRPQNWLLTIAHNAARSRVRLAMRRPKEVPLDDVVNQLVVPEEERTNVRELLRALGRLPFNQRAAITMRELEGRSYPEIAETLGVSVPAVEALLTRARKTMRLHAAAIRGLTFVGLPRSLRRLLENGDATAGSALGAGVAAKAVAVVVAGIAAGGAGLGISEAGKALAQPARPAPVRQVELVAAPVGHPRFRTRAGAIIATKAMPATRRAAQPRPVMHAPAGGPAEVPAQAAEPARPAAAPASTSSPVAAPSPEAPTRSHPVQAALTDTTAATTTAATTTAATTTAAATAAVTAALPAAVASALPPLPSVPSVPSVLTSPSVPPAPSAPTVPSVPLPSTPPLPAPPDPSKLPTLSTIP